MVQTILLHYLKEAAPQVLQAKFDKATNSVVTGMRSKGLSPETASLTVLVRDALFRLFRSVILSGDIADLCRDHIDAAVVRLVQRGITDYHNTSLAEIVKATAKAAVDIIF